MAEKREVVKEVRNVLEEERGKCLRGKGKHCGKFNSAKALRKEYLKKSLDRVEDLKYKKVPPPLSQTDLSGPAGHPRHARSDARDAQPPGLL